LRVLVGENQSVLFELLSRCVEAGRAGAVWLLLASHVVDRAL